ncbi:two-component system histidine kinase [Alcaligenes faecalis subsp. faecalis NCIB 8687]|nr:two-component system histidine kinase [Alcaligenes faecalis subsp. faecalis NCIB 8687]
MILIFGPLFLLWTVGIVITYFIAQLLQNLIPIGNRAASGRLFWYFVSDGRLWSVFIEKHAS